jgi:E3 ubiquitin-protein ligase MARCH6
MGNLHVETVVPERVAPQPVPLDRENNAGWNMWFDVDNNGGAMTFSEFIGISGSLISVLQNALVVVACNLSAIHVLVVVPYFATKAIFKGHLMSWMSFCIGTVNSFYSPSTYTGEEVDDLLWIKSTFSGIQEALSLHASFTFTFVSKFLIRVTEFLPNIILTNLVLLKKMLIASLDLFRFNKGSYVDYILQMTVGYVLVAGVGWLYRAMVLERKPKLEGVSRNIDQMLCLLGAFLKLAMLLVLILVIFPIYSGWVIDISLLPLFSSSFTDRLAFYNSHSLLSQLIHWTVGTIVLINISFLVSWLRTVLRPGLLFFISNSSDPDHMPIKDMIVTPLTVQINRYFRSLIVYGLALFGHFYGFSLICRLLVPKLTPLNFSFRNFTAEVPYDLLSNLFIKFLSDILNPGMVSKTTTAFMRLVIRSLRLSSYFHGGRYLSEESLAFGRWVFVPDFDRAYKLEKIEAMFNRPVQPWDIAKIEIVQGRESLNQLNQQSAQNMPVEPRRPRRPPAQIDRHDSTKGFTVVYRPNQFKIRVCAFLGAMFGIFQAFGLLMFVAPILVGRFVLGYFVEPGFSPYEFHTFQIGVIILGLCMKIGQMIYESVSQSGLKTVITSVLRVPIVAIKAVIVASTMFVLWPTLGGIYLMLVTTPFVSSLNETPTYPVFTCWVIGFMYARLLIMLRSMICSEKRARILDRLATFEGWWHMRFKEVILHLIVPYTVRALLLMFGPPMAVLLLSPLLELSFAQILMLQRWSYLLSLAVPFIAIGIWLIRNARQQFVNRIRDEHYLVGRRLHNLERPNAENRPVDTMPAVIA